MRVGFIIDGCIPSLAAVVARKAWLHHLLIGWNTGSAMGRMRFDWVARAVNRLDAGARYELYRPWRSYAAVVFLKSFSPECLALAQTLRARGTQIVFEINVDYFTAAEGEFHYEGMAPSAGQRDQAVAMAQGADLVIAASQPIAESCAPFSARVEWVPDNVNFDLVPELSASPATPVSLWWSGEAVKLFELLAIEDALRKHRDHFRLRLVTSSLHALDRWRGDLAQRFKRLLETLNHEIIPFTTLHDLLRSYHGGGFTFSPRFLDNSYNLGHTEWKLTLGMACGLPALASPVPSYNTLAARAAPGAIRVCDNSADWDAAFAEAFHGTWGAPKAAREVVRAHYATEVVARQHLSLLQSLRA